eukprot:2214714-Pleurochrysis_carterae.AAC.2
MAEGFESHSRILPTTARAHSSDLQQSEAEYAKAMEYINSGLKLDQNSPFEAVSYYQKGADAVSRALESAPPGELSDKMQYTLNMVEGRVRDITRDVMGRSITDSQGRQAALPGIGLNLGMLPLHCVDVLEASVQLQRFTRARALCEGVPSALRSFCASLRTRRTG